MASFNSQNLTHQPSSSTSECKVQILENIVVKKATTQVIPQCTSDCLISGMTNNISRNELLHYHRESENSAITELPDLGLKYLNFDNLDTNILSQDLDDMGNFKTFLGIKENDPIMVERDLYNLIDTMPDLPVEPIQSNEPNFVEPNLDEWVQPYHSNFEQSFNNVYKSNFLPNFSSAFNQDNNKQSNVLPNFETAFGSNYKSCLELPNPTTSELLSVNYDNISDVETDDEVIETSQNYSNISNDEDDIIESSQNLIPISPLIISSQQSLPSSSSSSCSSMQNSPISDMSIPETPHNLISSDDDDDINISTSPDLFGSDEENFQNSSNITNNFQETSRDLFSSGSSRQTSSCPDINISESSDDEDIPCGQVGRSQYDITNSYSPINELAETFENVQNSPLTFSCFQNCVSTQTSIPNPIKIPTFKITKKFKNKNKKISHLKSLAFCLDSLSNSKDDRNEQEKWDRIKKVFNNLVDSFE